MQRNAERLVIALLFVNAMVQVWRIAGNWGMQDVDAYWDAALRLRGGEPLYPTGVDPDSYRIFRYAPWFAWLWVPLTHLPRTAVEVGWGALLAAAALAVLIGLARLRSPAAWALALALTPWLLSLVQVGNIQPLVVALLAFGVSRASGPLWIGVTASLKAVPILWVLVYLARRQWKRLLAAVGATALLASPFLLYDLEGYATEPGRSAFSLWYWVSPEAWFVGAAVSVTAALVLAWRRSPWLWPAIAVAAMLVAPRSHMTYATYLVIGMLAGSRDRIRPNGEPADATDLDTASYYRGPAANA